MKKDSLILIRGGGDLATGTIHRLWSAGLRVLVLETNHPAAIRRQVSVCEAVYDGETTVEGMRAVRVDALDDAELSGTVQKIAPLGDTSASVTTYDVTVAITGEDARVKGGMNVSGEIVVNTAENATLIPTDALQKDDEGYFVTLQSGEIRRVTIGVMTDDTTQILEGISVGETVVY